MVNFEAALSESPQGIVIVDRSFKIVFINTAAVILLKTPATQAINKKLSEVIFPGDKAKIQMHDSYMNNVFKIGVSTTQSMNGRLIDYKSKKLKIALCIIDNYCVAYIDDFTEFAAMEAKLLLKPNDAILLKTSDIRVRIINLLVALMLSLVIASTVVSALGHKEQSRVLDSLLAGFVGVFSSCAGFFFRDDKKDS